MPEYVVQHEVTHVRRPVDVPEGMDLSSEWERAGWHVVDGLTPADLMVEIDAEGAPKGNSSRDEWEGFALIHGFTREVIAPLNRDEIRELVGKRLAPDVQPAEPVTTTKEED